MKRNSAILSVILAAVFLAGCSFPRITPTASPTPVVLSSPTPLLATSTPTAVPPTATESAPTNTPAATPTTGGGTTGGPTGPYAVIGISSGSVLNVYAAAGGGRVIDSFTSTANNVMRTGPTATVGKYLWVQVQSPNGQTGWVNTAYLTEYVSAAAFCADTRVHTLLTDFGSALDNSDGVKMASLVSPTHGMAVRLWRNGRVVTFYPKDARWFFGSTYKHNWGAAPGSGLNTIGSFHEVVLPKWRDVFDAPAGYSASCNAVETGGASYDTSWPDIYTNVNFYSFYKAGPAGNENSWRTLLIGVEYVQGQPYVFSVIHLDWEP